MQKSLSWYVCKVSSHVGRKHCVRRWGGTHFARLMTIDIYIVGDIEFYCSQIMEHFSILQVLWIELFQTVLPFQCDFDFCIEKLFRLSVLASF